MPSSAPAWLRLATSGSCRWLRSSSLPSTGRRSKIVSAMLRSAGLSNTGQMSQISGRSLSRGRSLCQPADRRSDPRRQRKLYPDLQTRLTSDDTEYLTGAELSEHRQTVSQRGKRTTTIYRWLSAIPLRATEDALAVNWFSVEIRNHTGKRTYYNSFITDLPVTAENVAELAACGRARCRVGGDVAIPTPHSAGRAGSPHPVPHGRASLTAAYG